MPSPKYVSVEGPYGYLSYGYFTLGIEQGDSWILETSYTWAVEYLNRHPSGSKHLLHTCMDRYGWDCSFGIFGRSGFGAVE